MLVPGTSYRVKINECFPPQQGKGSPTKRAKSDSKKSSVGRLSTETEVRVNRRSATALVDTRSEVRSLLTTYQQNLAGKKPASLSWISGLGDARIPITGHKIVSVEIENEDGVRMDLGRSRGGLQQARWIPPSSPHVGRTDPKNDAFPVHKEAM